MSGPFTAGRMDDGSARAAGMERTGFAALLPACIMLVLCAAAVTARADSPAKLVDRGNGSYAGGEYDRAIEYYEKASVRAPESPIIAFNTGNVHYKKENFAAAREHYREATLGAADISLEAKAWFNMGNCAFREGERQVDGDLEKALDDVIGRLNIGFLEKALEFFQESVQLYTTSLEKDPELTEAAYNIEVARLIIKDLLDRIKNQEEQMQRQQQRLQAVADSLRALIRRQEEAAAKSTELDASKDTESKRWIDDLHGVEERQDGIADGTAAVQDSLHAMFPDTIPPQVDEALLHCDSSLIDQSGALESLSAREAGRAAVDQERSRDQLKKALEALTDSQKGDQHQDQPRDGSQQQQPQQQQQPREQEQREKEQQKSETAQGILDEEKENKERRQAAGQSYRSVDRDW